MIRTSERMAKLEGEEGKKMDTDSRGNDAATINDSNDNLEDDFETDDHGMTTGYGAAPRSGFENGSMEERITKLEEIAKNYENKLKDIQSKSFFLSTVLCMSREEAETANNKKNG